MSDTPDRNPDGTFVEGKSPCPGGVPKDVRKAAKKHTRVAISTLLEILQDAKAPHSARVRAAEVMLDRGWGKPQVDLAVEGKGDLGSFLAQFFTKP